MNSAVVNAPADPGLDFTGCLGRLLRSGTLRDRFAGDPGAVLEEMRARATDRGALMALRPVDLEAQARILLRKRYGLVTGLIPRTISLLGEAAWTEFRIQARDWWPAAPGAAVRDAARFCDHLHASLPGRVCDSERNRMRFTFAPGRISIHLVRDPSLSRILPYGLQILARLPRERRVDWTLHLG